MTKKETEERVRLLEYEVAILRHEIDEIKKHVKAPIKPMFPFARLEKHSMGCSWSLPTYEELKKKYKVF